MKYRVQLLLLILLTSSLTLFGQKKQINDPVKNFEILWKYFDDHYAFFDLKKIAWEEMYKKYKSQINDSTINDSLFAICSRMLGEFKDGHVGIADGDKYFGIAEHNNFYTEFPKWDLVNNLIRVTDTSLTKLGFCKPVKYYGDDFKNKSIIEFSTTSNYGYIRINSMQGISKFKLKRILSTATKQFKSVKGVIIDVRFNGGGEDTYSYQIAGRFTDKKRIGHYKCTRKKKGHNDFSKLETWYLKPTGARQITAPIILLTSNASASATDVFVLAMKQLPYVTIIGDNTFGVFSDRLVSKLPNGWEFSLSHQKYFSADMKCYEAVGISPDIKLQNSMSDITQNKDPLIFKAVEVLHQNTK